MKISAISSANSLSFSRKNKYKESNHHPPITYDVQKVRTALFCTASVALAGMTYALIKDSGNNSIKTAYNNVKEVAKEMAPDPMAMAVGHKRNALSVEKYKKYVAKTKLANLQQRIENGEFRELPAHAIKNIEMQRDKLLKNANIIK